MIGQRGFITGLISLVAAPAIVRASSLMPVKVMVEPGIRYRAVPVEDMIDALLHDMERRIYPPFGISPCQQALIYLDEHDRIMRRIIHENEYLVGR